MGNKKMSLEEARKIASEAQNPTTAKESLRDKIAKYALLACILLTIGGIIL
jgi:hypothetical protein